VNHAIVNIASRIFNLAIDRRKEVFQKILSCRLKDLSARNIVQNLKGNDHSGILPDTKERENY